MDALNEDEMRHMIRQMRYNYETDKDLAIYLGISTAYLHDIMKGNRKVGIKAANKLGYKPVQVYILVKGDGKSAMS